MNEHQEDAGSLRLQALLYACGEMAVGDADAFEARLADDQEARDALVAAVGLIAPLSSSPLAGPAPAYRERVRERLRAAAATTTMRPRVGVRRARSHGLVWALTGAAAAVLLIAVVNTARSPSVPGAELLQGAPARVAPAESPGPRIELIYSDLTNTERVTRIRGEQTQRRQRQEEFLLPHHPLTDVLGPATPPGPGPSM